MTNASFIPFDTYGGFEGFSNEQFRVVLEAGAANYSNWMLKVLAAWANNAAPSASVVDELRPFKPTRPVDTGTAPSLTANAAPRPEEAS